MMIITKIKLTNKMILKSQGKNIKKNVVPNTSQIIFI